MKGWMSRTEALKPAFTLARSHKIVFSVLLTLLMGTLLVETAQGSKGFDQQFYAGFGLGVSELDPDSMCPCLTVGDGTDQGFTVFLGVDLAKRLTVEGFYSNLGEAGIQFNNDDVGEVDYQVAGISALGYLFGTRLGQTKDKSSALSAREGLSVFVRLGVGAMDNDSNLSYERDHTTHFHTGLGLEYGWANGFAVRGEVTAYDSDAALAAITLLKRFGKDRSKPVRTVPRKNFTAIADPEALPEPEPEAEPETPVPMTVAYFDFSKSELNTEARATLDVLATAMAANETQTFSLEGHTDEIDSEEFNMMLSINRAAAVKQYLQDKGIDPVRMVITGFGESQPVATNATAEGRSLNRRVEIVPRDTVTN